MKTDREALEAAIELIDNPEHWTQEAYVRDAHGVDLGLRSSSDAHSRCLVGALIETACNADQQRRLIRAIETSLDTAARGIRIYAFVRLIEFNDTHLHEDVILAMKRGLDRLGDE